MHAPYFDSLPGKEYAKKHPKYNKHNWAFHYDNPKSTRKRSMQKLQPIRKYFFHEFENGLSRCLVGKCSWVIRSEDPKELFPHLCSHHSEPSKHHSGWNAHDEYLERMGRICGFSQGGYTQSRYNYLNCNCKYLRMVKNRIENGRKQQK